MNKKKYLLVTRHSSLVTKFSIFNYQLKKPAIGGFCVVENSGIEPLTS